jgi:hypothetical protein
VRPIGLEANALPAEANAVMDDLKSLFGAPGKARRFQRVKFPSRQGVSRSTGDRVLDSWR